MANSQANCQLFLTTCSNATSAKSTGEPLVEQDEVISEEDLQAWETERQLQELQTAVNEEVNLKHPIEYNGHDICGLTKRGMLKSKFKLPQLKEICTLFGIEI